VEDVEKIEWEVVGLGFSMGVSVLWDMPSVEDSTAEDTKLFRLIIVLLLLLFWCC